MVAYAHREAPLRELAIWDGFDSVTSPRTGRSVGISGLDVPAGANGSLGGVAYDGDRGPGGESLSDRMDKSSPVPLSDGSNPAATGGSLSAKDAPDLGAVILGSMVPQGNRKARTWLKSCRIELQDPQIHYFPFARADLFWKELNTGISFQHNAFPGDLPPIRG